MDSFVEEGLGIDGTNGYTMSSQQRQACVEISKLVFAKRVVNMWDWKLETPNEKKYAASFDVNEYAQKIGISIMSGQGPGKDAFAAWAIIWLEYCFRPEVLIPCTGPGEDQLKNILWPETGRWLNKRGDDGQFLVLPDIRKSITVSATKIFYTPSGGKQDFAMMKTANVREDAEAQAKTLYGLHEKYMMIVVEEAAGVPEPVFKPLEGTLTREVNFVLMVFNPIFRTGFAIDSQMGPFSHKWINLQWDAEESEIVQKQHIKDMEDKFGRASNTFRTLVKGLPPLAEPDTIIPYDWVMAAIDRPIEPDDSEPRIGGCDPGAGGDNSVIRIRHGLKVLNTNHRHTSPSSIEVGDWAAGVAIKEDLDAIFFDVIGIGNGAYYQCKKVLKGVSNSRGREIKVYSVDVRNSADDEDRYFNKRSELIFKARNFFEEGTISIPNNQFLKEELWSIKKKQGNNKKETAEPKEDTKKRLKFEQSPNDADALFLTFAKNDSIFRHIHKKKEEFDVSPWAYLQRRAESARGWLRV